MPFASPVTVIGLSVPVHVMSPGCELAAYSRIGAPPSDSGGEKKTSTLPLTGSRLLFALTSVGAPGLVDAGVTETEDGVPAPTTLFAVRLNLYSIFFRLLTVIGLDALVTVTPAGETEVNVYDVTGIPPFDTGALKAIVVLSMPGVAVTLVGAPGAIAGVMYRDHADADPAPIPLVAFTLNV